MSHNSFGQWLRWRREALDLTRKELAQSVGCSEVLIRKLEMDARRPSQKTAVLLAEQLKVAPERHVQFIEFARSGQASFSPLVYWTSTVHAPTNLVMPPTRLIGREKQVNILCGKLWREDVRLLSLVGPPGIGKTRLALEVAWRLVDRYEDGVYFVALDRISNAELVPSAIVNTLGLSFNSNQPPLEAIIRYLQDRHILLVLDNFEHVIAAAAQVADLLAVCPFLHILTTSRATLRLREEHQYRVPPLVTPQVVTSQIATHQALQTNDELLEYSAVVLFVERARSADPNFELLPHNRAAVFEICARLDGLPLAIELIAAYVKALSPHELIPLVNGRFMLRSKTQVDVPSQRHETLEAAIDSSYYLLTPALQRLFAQLSVFAEGWNLKSAQAVCDMESDSILTGLIALLDRSLIQQERLPNDATRFKMLIPVREYAAEQLKAEGLTQQTHDRHCAYFCDFAEAGGEKMYTGAEHVAFLERFDAEYTDLCAALEWCEQDAQHADNRLRLIGGLEWYWVLRGRIQEGYHYSQRALAESSGDVLVSRRARALLASVRLALFYGDFDYAVAFAGEVHRLYIALGDKQGIAFSLIYLGYLALLSGDLAHAKSRWQESFSLAQEVGEPSQVAFIHFFLGNFYYSIPPRRNLEEARQHTEHGLAAARGISSQWMMSLNLIVLASVNVLEGHLLTAQTQFEECFTLSQMLKDRRGCAAAQNGLAKIALLMGYPQNAQAIYAENLQFFYEINYRSGIIECLFGLAETFIALDKPRQAVQLLAFVEPNLDFHLIVAIDREQFQRHVTAMRESLGGSDFSQCWKTGQTLHWNTLNRKTIFQL